MRKSLLKVLSLVATMVLTAFSAAAEGQYAILTHDGETTVFRGANSLNDAHGAAVDGDVITLSPGVFNNVDISKSITIHGSGIDNLEKVSYIDRLAIAHGDEDEDGKHITVSVKVEGITGNNLYIYHNETNTLVEKCRFEAISPNPFESQGQYAALNIKHSIINDLEHKAEIVNCVIKNVCNDYVNALNSVFINQFPWHGEFTNCIVFRANDWYDITATNTVFIHDHTKNYDSYSRFNNSMEMHGNGCLLFPEGTQVFKEDSDWWELLDENANSWLGTDGTQVGVHGGLLPFTAKPDAPRFSVFEVADKTTDEGILNVKIRLED